MRLFTPGPTPVPPEVLKVMAEPMIHHRSEEFAEILSEVRKNLKWLCGTEAGEVVCFSSSGSGGMEAVVASFFAPQDEVLVVSGGKFGQRWASLASHYGLKVNLVAVPWGRAVGTEEVLAQLTPNTKGVLIQACETSTGVDHPIRAIGQALRERSQALFIVDAITALGVYDLDMDRDGMDALVCGSQKALMTPPGLATVALSSRAVEALGKVSSQSQYFSLQTELKAEQKNTSAFTPAVPLFKGLRVALGMIRKEGKPALFARTLLMQNMARRAFRKVGLEMFNRDEEATKGITVVVPPADMDVKVWLSQLKQNEGLWLAGGQSELAGKIFRVSHMGAIQPQNLLGAIESMEKYLTTFLPRAKDGVAVAEAKRVMEGA